MIKENDIVYFIESSRLKALDYDIRFGIVSYIDGDNILIDFLRVKENRLVEGIPFDDFEETPWMKVPKGKGAHEMRPKIESSLTEEESKLLRDLKATDPKDVKYAYDIGLLVKKGDLDTYSVIETELDRNKPGKYRFVKKVPGWQITYGQDQRSYACKNKNEVATTYDEAKRIKAAKIKKTREEYGCDLSDYDYSVREIEKVLRRFPEDIKERYKQVLLAKDNVEDIEITKRGDNVYWRYFGSYHSKDRTDWELIELDQT